jgi:hypothetical protein
MKHDLMSYRVIPRQRNREVNICVTVWSHLAEGVNESSARIGEAREIKYFAVYENWERSLVSLLDKNAEEVTVSSSEIICIFKIRQCATP